MKISIEKILEFAKLIPIIAGFIYVIGFLISSSFLGQFNVSSFEILRSKYIFTGVIFLTIIFFIIFGLQKNLITLRNIIKNNFSQIRIIFSVIFIDFLILGAFVVFFQSLNLLANDNSFIHVRNPDQVLNNEWDLISLFSDVIKYFLNRIYSTIIFIISLILSPYLINIIQSNIKLSKLTFIFSTIYAILIIWIWGIYVTIFNQLSFLNLEKKIYNLDNWSILAIEFWCIFSLLNLLSTTLIVNSGFVNKIHNEPISVKDLTLETEVESEKQDQVKVGEAHHDQVGVQDVDHAIKNHFVLPTFILFFVAVFFFHIYFKVLPAYSSEFRRW